MPQRQDSYGAEDERAPSDLISPIGLAYALAIVGRDRRPRCVRTRKYGSPWYQHRHRLDTTRQRRLHPVHRRRAAMQTGPSGAESLRRASKATAAPRGGRSQAAGHAECRYVAEGAAHGVARSAGASSVVLEPAAGTDEAAMLRRFHDGSPSNPEGPAKPGKSGTISMTAKGGPDRQHGSTCRARRSEDRPFSHRHIV